MKEIKAIIQPFMMQKVMDDLKSIPNMPGVTVSEVKGFGSSRTQGNSTAVDQWGILLVPKLKLETVVSDDMVDEVVSTIQKSAHTGNIGDGKIFIYEIKDIVRIRTGKRGQQAL